ncbi:hypothetical protein AVEN_226948-1 [Araneus ventricosus]|uniref:Uncharacterized protein n=1 Tax=Araneus ventricosus TaxID=182803 RepID=A0A4Y2T181_ARAVE|nr:hypothetical protein AVEN_226948-1 [Araneus ventricosus]
MENSNNRDSNYRDSTVMLSRKLPIPDISVLAFLCRSLFTVADSSTHIWFYSDWSPACMSGPNFQEEKKTRAA